jgi:hypothetical protein
VLMRAQTAQKVVAALNEFKRTRLVGTQVGGRTEWRGSRIGGELEGEWVQRCVDDHTGGSEN